MEQTPGQTPVEGYVSASLFKIMVSLKTSSASYQCHRVAQQNESRRVVRQVVANLVETLVYCLLFILLNLLGRLVDHVCKYPQPHHQSPFMRVKDTQST